MTNQVNQAFEEWIPPYWNKNKHIDDEGVLVYSDDLTQGAFIGYRAATQASESEINSLKQQVEELESKLEAMTDSNNLNHRLASKWADESTELTASNNQLREALETARDYQFDAVNQFHSDFAGYKEDKHKQYDEDLAKTDNALSSTPEKSLADHDNEVVERCKNIVADDALAITFQSMGTYRSAIIKQIGELKAIP